MQGPVSSTENTVPTPMVPPSSTPARNMAPSYSIRTVRNCIRGSQLWKISVRMSQGVRPKPDFFTSEIPSPVNAGAAAAQHSRTPTPADASSGVSSADHRFMISPIRKVPNSVPKPISRRRRASTSRSMAPWMT